MGATTSAKRGEARRAPAPPSHIQREVIGVILIALSLLTLLSLLSFVPGEAETVASGAPAAAPPRNLIGSFGAVLAGGFFFLIGGAAYLFPPLLGKLGLRCFSQSPVSIRLRTAVSSLGAVLFLSAFLHLEATAVPTLSSGFVHRGMAGGVFGQVLADGLRSWFASTGAHIVILASFLVSLLFTTPLSLTELVQGFPERWAAWREKLAALMPEPAIEPPVESGNRRQRSRAVKERPEPEPEQASADAALMESESPAVTEWPVIQPPIASFPTPAEANEPEVEVVSAQVDAGDYELPDPDELLSDPTGPITRMSDEELKAQSDVLTRALASFGIIGKVTEVRPGPVVTMYEFEPSPGTKVARIVNLADDLALGFKAISLRIVAPIPGKSVVGIEVPNLARETVSMKEVVMSETFTKARSKLTLALGKDIFGAPAIADLKTMPHLLVAGATGAGKSVGLNTMLLSILFSARPSEVKLLVDRSEDAGVFIVRRYPPLAATRHHRCEVGGARVGLGGGRDGTPVQAIVRSRRAEYRCV